MLMSDWNSQIEIMAKDDIIDDSSSDSDCVPLRAHENRSAISTQVKSPIKSPCENISYPSSSGPEIIVID